MKDRVLSASFRNIDWKHEMAKHENLAADFDDLEKVPSKQDGKRTQYLRKNIVDRYYPNEPEFSYAHFGSGVPEDWLPLHVDLRHREERAVRCAAGMALSSPQAEL
eukprot:IDg13807t1